jgi:predicted DNA-binding transcriptional regulator AlpA
LLTARQASAALGISERLLWELTNSGQIPCLRIPGRGKARSIRYATADLEHWIERTKAEQMAAKTDSSTTKE